MKVTITVDFFKKGPTVNSASLLPTLKAKSDLFIEWSTYIEYPPHERSYLIFIFFNKKTSFI